MAEVECTRTDRRLRPERRDIAAFLLLAAGAVAVTYGILWARAIVGEGFPSIDIYEYSHPIFLYAQRALEQGHGLLWNPLQNSGQPFFAIPSVMLLYPPTLIGLAFDAQGWLVGQAVFHLFVASAGSYVLARVMRLSRGAAVASALAMLLGGLLIALAAWSPIVLGAYAWISWVAALTEYLIRRPAPGPIVGLGAVLTLQILAGYPQIVVFSYELCALRLAWHLMRPEGDRWRPVAAVVIGMTLPVGFAAVQLLPTAEIFRDSVRSLPIAKDALQVGSTSNSEILESIWERSQIKSAFFVSVAGGALAVAALAVRRNRSMMIFYVFVGLLSVGLVFDSLLLDAYQMLPIVGELRGPDRFFWVTSLAMSVLVGFGVQALGDRRTTRIAACLGLVVVGAFAVLGDGPMRWWEWPIAMAVLIPCLGALRHREVVVPLTICAALAVCLWMQNRAPFLIWLADDAALRQGGAVFERIAESGRPGRVVTNERRRKVYPRFLNEKTPSLFGLAGASDYEHLTSRRYAELYLTMVGISPVTSANQWIKGRVGQPRHRPILDLLGVRWIVTSGEYRPDHLGARPIVETGAWHLFENRRALPRVSFVPTAVVIEDREERLSALADRNFDPRRTVVLDEAASDGFVGDPRANGSAALLIDESETLIVETQSSGVGFLLIADQHHPSWTAQIDGVEVPILRANHALRAIRVPKGASTVELRFRPWSLPVGAAVSLLSIASCLLWVRHASRRAADRDLGSGLLPDQRDRAAEDPECAP